MTAMLPPAERTETHRPHPDEPAGAPGTARLPEQPTIAFRRAVLSLAWRTLRSGSSTPASAASRSPGRCSTSCRTSRCSTSATPRASPTARKPIGEVREYALECLDHLVDQGVKVLVIACNSASAAVLRDARERYAGAGRRGDPARPTRRAVAATRNGRVGVICTAGDRPARWPTTTRSRPPPRSRCTTQACPRFVEFVEAGRHRRAGAAGRGPRVPRPGAPRGIDTLILGCTHYPLLTGVISYVMGDGVTLVSSAEETAKDVYRAARPTRPRARRGLPAAEAPVPHHRASPSEFARARAPLPRPRASIGGVDAVRRGGSRMKLTVVGCSGSLPGPGLAGLLLPRRGRTRADVPARARPRQRRARRPAALRRPRDIDAVLISHLHPDHCFDLCGYYVARAATTPTAPLPGIPVYGPAGAAERLAPRLRPAERPGDAAASSTSTSGDAGAREIGPFAVHGRAVAHPVEAYGMRVEHERPVAGLLRRHRRLPGAGRAGHGTPTCCCARRRSSTARDNPPDLHLTGRQAAEPRPRPGSAGCVLTHIPPWHDRPRCWRTRPPPSTARSSWRHRRGVRPTRP